MDRTWLSIPALCLLAVFFGRESYVAWTEPAVRAAGGSVGPGSVPSPASVADGNLPPSDHSAMTATIVSRPLFRADRRPFREDQAEAAKRNYEAEISRFTLLGVFIMGGDKKGIVTGKGATGKEERWELSVGDDLSGFKVKEIAADGLTLTADGREFPLPLYAGAPKGSGGQAPARTDAGGARPAGTAPQPSLPVQPGIAPRTPAAAVPVPQPVRIQQPYVLPGNEQAPPSIRNRRPPYMPSRGTP